jgi:hypothetical protein
MVCSWVEDLEQKKELRKVENSGSLTERHSVTMKDRGWVG